jgi:predicted nucleotidyltransferase
MDLEEYLARQLGVKVDLVPRHALKGEIGERILHEVVPI